MYKISNKLRQTIPVVIRKEGEDLYYYLGFEGSERTTFSEDITFNMESLRRKGFIKIEKVVKESKEFNKESPKKHFNKEQEKEEPAFKVDTDTVTADPDSLKNTSILLDLDKKKEEN